jgi:uncharacterized protein HemX
LKASYYRQTIKNLATIDREDGSQAELLAPDEEWAEREGEM